MPAGSQQPHGDSSNKHRPPGRSDQHGDWRKGGNAVIKTRARCPGGHGEGIMLWPQATWLRIVRLVGDERWQVKQAR